MEQGNDLMGPVLIDRRAIADRIEQMGQEITRVYEDSPHQVKYILALVVLQGGFVFAADLARAIEYPMKFRFIEVTTIRNYKDAAQTTVEMSNIPSLSFNGEHVLIIDTIVDTGRTIRYLKDFIRSRQPIAEGTTRVASLLHKPAGGSQAHEVDFVGFTMDKDQVCGYGLDLHGWRRNLPDLMHLRG